tara:strand:- start:947 stop:2641 length:1695 start_codon:yes stop_codon:yes gene_type:complete
MNHESRQRIRQTITDEEATMIELKRQEFESQINIMKGKNELTMYPSQTNVADEVYEIFQDLTKLLVMVVAPTQSGKTGMMLAIIQKFVTDYTIDTEDIYIVTGLSDKEWEEQTKARFPPCMSKNILHRPRVSGKKNQKPLSELIIQRPTNVLIIIDEVHYASNESRTLNKYFDLAGTKDADTSYTNDVKILQVTATPGDTMNDLRDWPAYMYHVNIHRPENNYTGPFHLQENKQLKQCLDLCGGLVDEDELKQMLATDEFGTNTMIVAALIHIRQLKEDIQDNFKEARYHIIRTQVTDKGKQTIALFTHVFGEDNFKYTSYDSGSKGDDINDILKKAPDKHTFIFIKEKERCGKTLWKKHIGVVYERSTRTPKCDTIIQGLLGRVTGWDKFDGICYTDMASVELYLRDWDNNFELTSVRRNKKKEQTMNHHSTWEGVNSDTQPPTPTSTPRIREDAHRAFDSREELDRFWWKYIQEYDRQNKIDINRRRPRNFKPNEDGFCPSSLGRSTDGSHTKVRTMDELLRDLKERTVDTDHPYYHYVAYKDITDPNSVQYVFHFIQKYDV